MATEATLVRIEMKRDGDSFIGSALFGPNVTEHDDKKRTLTFTYEWHGKGLPPNFEQLIKDHPSMVYFDFGSI